MSDRTKSGLATLGIVFSIAVGSAGFIQAWALIPYRVQLVEAEQRTMKEERKVDREILIRIEEQVKAMREEVKKQRRNNYE